MNTAPVEPGRWYRFRLTDVICPDYHQAQQQITADLEVAGEVVFLSDHGLNPDRFAIIEVAGIQSPLVVPIDRLQTERAGRLGKSSESAPVNEE